MAFVENGNTYYYQTDDLSMNLGDEVDVPVGPQNALKAGGIVKMECFTPKQAPFPADQVKEMQGKPLIKKAIGNFKVTRTTDNRMFLLFVLSDSMIWVPCNARLGEEDQKQLEEMAGREENKDSLSGLFLHRKRKFPRCRIFCREAKNISCRSFPAGRKWESTERTFRKCRILF